MHHDAIVIGSGFGGSVAALRLAEKGYAVLVLEKGKRFGLADFPKTNWDLKKWMWNPALGFQGIFKMTFFEHVTIFSGVGVGGGSLVYANTLPVPKREFFRDRLVGRSPRLGARARAALRDREADARRRPEPEPRDRRQDPPRNRPGNGPKRAFRPDRRRGLFR